VPKDNLLKRVNLLLWLQGANLVLTAVIALLVFTGVRP